MEASRTRVGVFSSNSHSPHNASDSIYIKDMSEYKLS